MYEDGTLPRDPAKASYWEAKFKADKVTADQDLETQKNDEIAFQKEALYIQNVNETAKKRVLQAQHAQNIATTVMLGLFLGALVEGIGGSSGSGSPDGDFEQNRRDSIDRGCRSGDSYACYQQDPLSSDNDH
jgi:hypothetical protein